MPKRRPFSKLQSNALPPNGGDDVDASSIGSSKSSSSTNSRGSKSAGGGGGRRRRKATSSKDGSLAETAASMTDDEFGFLSHKDTDDKLIYGNHKTPKVSNVTTNATAAHNNDDDNSSTTVKTNKRPAPSTDRRGTDTAAAPAPATKKARLAYPPNRRQNASAAMDDDCSSVSSVSTSHMLETIHEEEEETLSDGGDAPHDLVEEDNCSRLSWGAGQPWPPAHVVDAKREQRLHLAAQLSSTGVNATCTEERDNTSRVVVAPSMVVAGRADGPIPDHMPLGGAAGPTVLVGSCASTSPAQQHSYAIPSSATEEECKTSMGSAKILGDADSIGLQEGRHGDAKTLSIPRDSDSCMASAAKGAFCAKEMASDVRDEHDTSHPRSTTPTLTGDCEESPQAMGHAKAFRGNAAASSLQDVAMASSQRSSRGLHLAGLGPPPTSYNSNGAQAERSSSDKIKTDCAPNAEISDDIHLDTTPAPTTSGVSNFSGDERPSQSKRAIQMAHFGQDGACPEDARETTLTGKSDTPEAETPSPLEASALDGRMFDDSTPAASASPESSARDAHNLDPCSSSEAIDDTRDLNPSTSTSKGDTLPAASSKDGNTPVVPGMSNSLSRPSVDTPYLDEVAVNGTVGSCQSSDRRAFGSQESRPKALRDRQAAERSPGSDSHSQAARDSFSRSGSSKSSSQELSNVKPESPATKGNQLCLRGTTKMGDNELTSPLIGHASSMPVRRVPNQSKTICVRKVKNVAAMSNRRSASRKHVRGGEAPVSILQKLTPPTRPQSTRRWKSAGSSARQNPLARTRSCPQLGKRRASPLFGLSAMLGLSQEKVIFTSTDHDNTKTDQLKRKRRRPHMEDVFVDNMISNVTSCSKAESEIPPASSEPSCEPLGVDEDGSFHSAEILATQCPAEPVESFAGAQIDISSAAASPPPSCTTAMRQLLQDVAISVTQNNAVVDHDDKKEGGSIKEDMANEGSCSQDDREQYDVGEDACSMAVPVNDDVLEQYRKHEPDDAGVLQAMLGAEARDVPPSFVGTELESSDEISVLSEATQDCPQDCARRNSDNGSKDSADIEDIARRGTGASGPSESLNAAADATQNGAGSACERPLPWTMEIAGFRPVIYEFPYRGRRYCHPPLPPGWELVMSRTRERPYYKHPDHGVSFFSPVALPIGNDRFEWVRLDDASIKSASSCSNTGSPSESRGVGQRAGGERSLSEPPSHRKLNSAGTSASRCRSKSRCVTVGTTPATTFSDWSKQSSVNVYEPDYMDERSSSPVPSPNGAVSRSAECGTGLRSRLKTDVSQTPTLCSPGTTVMHSSGADHDAGNVLSSVVSKRREPSGAELHDNASQHITKGELSAVACMTASRPDGRGLPSVERKIHNCHGDDQDSGAAPSLLDKDVIRDVQCRSLERSNVAFARPSLAASAISGTAGDSSGVPSRSVRDEHHDGDDAFPLPDDDAGAEGSVSLSTNKDDAPSSPKNKTPHFASSDDDDALLQPDDDFDAISEYDDGDTVSELGIDGISVTVKYRGPSSGSGSVLSVRTRDTGAATYFSYRVLHPPHNFDSLQNLESLPLAKRNKKAQRSKRAYASPPSGPIPKDIVTTTARKRRQGLASR